jgi:hypothetical protein
MKLEFSASVGFIHKESVMIVKFSFSFLELLKVHWFISTVFTDNYGDLNRFSGTSVNSYRGKSAVFYILLCTATSRNVTPML